MLAAALMLPSVPAQAADYAWPVVRVIDGDTILVDASADLPPELADLRIRLRGVDTPETGFRARCDAERRAGEAARDFVVWRIGEAETVTVHDLEWGKWGGRIVADVILDGESLALALVQSFHGRWYAGDNKRAPWCPEAEVDAAELPPCNIAKDIAEQWVSYATGARWDGDKTFAEVVLERIVFVQGAIMAYAGTADDIGHLRHHSVRLCDEIVAVGPPPRAALIAPAHALGRLERPPGVKPGSRPGEQGASQRRAAPQVSSWFGFG